MNKRFLRAVALVLGLMIVVGSCVVDAGAQKRRKRRTRRARVTKPVVKPVITNPDIAPPGSESTGPDGEKIISTADDPTTETDPFAEPTPKKTGTAATPATETDMQQTINALSNQVDRLNTKLTQMQETERARLDMERLTRAEQRAENLRQQQLDVESKLADLQSKLEQTEYMLKPENIERAAGYGTTRPEEARESRKRQLENERARLQAQIRILEGSRTRLETALRTADAEVDALRAKIEGQTTQPEAARKPEQ